jgi:uncharacterized protein (TIGR02231 family)
LVEVLRFEAPLEQELVSMPELSPLAFLRCTLTNASRGPLLAGPVELAREGGVIGWTRCMFVAPGERFVMGFGADEALRVARSTYEKSDKIDPDTKWRHRNTRTSLFISNLDDASRTVTITERIPVSELKQVTVSINDQDTTQPYKLDEHGFCRWTLTLEPYTQQFVELSWTLSTSPDVK